MGRGRGRRWEGAKGHLNCILGWDHLTSIIGRVSLDEDSLGLDHWLGITWQISVSEVHRARWETLAQVWESRKALGQYIPTPKEKNGLGRSQHHRESHSKAFCLVARFACTSWCTAHPMEFLASSSHWHRISVCRNYRTLGTQLLNTFLRTSAPAITYWIWATVCYWRAGMRSE